MIKTPDDNSLQIAFKPSGQCRIAYTLNSTQPVRCTIIGDQPLFYMDFECEASDLAEEGTFDDKFAFESIEQGLVELREKISILDSLSGPVKSAALTMERFYDDLDIITRPARAAVSTDMSALETTLRKSRLAASFLDFGATFGSTMRYSHQVGTATYDRLTGTILINPTLSHADQILLAARELRRLWQHRNGALLHPLTFQPDQAILVNRAQIADLSVNMVRVAWELQLAGSKEAWERLETSSMADMARAFARESYLDFRTLNNGIAASAVFETWFLSDRCRGEDRKLIQQMLADYRGYVFDGSQPSQGITAELIAALGTMPFGKNYLAPYVQTIVSDAVFTEVRDRSNANFLWFIKFERSFRETEQELQKNGRQPSRPALLNKENSADIINLSDLAPAANAQVANGTNPGGAQILAFRANSATRSPQA